MSRKKKTSKFGIVINILIVITAACAALLALYPTIANLVNQIGQNENITTYTSIVQSVDTSSLDAMWEDAKEFNKKLAQNNGLFQLADSEKENYYDLLNIEDSGLIGYVDIPDQNIHLSVYHGTDDKTLETAVGHLEGTSLPTDGESVHCVITGHTGLPSLDLFTDIHEMKEGDVFTITTLNRILTYKVDNIEVVLPDELYGLKIINGRNYCTLVTCTPYGVNDHRLLVRGRLVDVTVTGTEEESVEGSYTVKANYAVIKLAVLVAAILAGFVIFTIWIFKKDGKNKPSGNIRITKRK